MIRIFSRAFPNTQHREFKHHSLTTSWRRITLGMAAAYIMPFYSGALASSVFTVAEISGTTVVSGTNQTLASVVSAGQQNTSTISSVSATVNQIYFTALSALQSSQLGQPDGPAALDASGSLTDPVATTTSTASDYATVGWNDAIQWTVTGTGSNIQEANPPVAFNHRWMMDNNTVDDYMPPTHLRLGGSQEFDGVPLFIHNIPYGEGNMGIVEGVYMQSENMRGSIAGVGVGDANGIATTDNFDAVARYTYAGPSSPVFTTTGAAVTAPDNLTHIPTFTSWGATFSNPLPQKWSDWIKAHNHVRMMTNELGASTGEIRTYAGVLTGYGANASGLITEIYTDGWRIFDQPSATANQIPGTSTADGSTPAIDTVWSDFTDPAIMFGVYTKAFANNVICYLPGPTPHAQPGDINDPTGKANNQTRSCEGIEYDLWDNDQTNNTAYMHGITVAYSGRSNPTADSYDMNLAGGNANMLEINGEWYSQNIASRPFASGSFGGPDYTQGSQKVVAEFDQSNSPGWVADTAWPGSSHDMRLTVWNTRNLDDTNNTNDYNDITTSMGVQVDGHNDIRSLSMDGTLQEHLEFNPATYPNGIALCGYSGCGFAVDRNGAAQLIADGTVTNGKSIYFNDANNVQRGNIWAGTDGAVHISQTAGDNGNVVVDARLKSNGAVNAPVSTYSALPTSGSVTGDQRYCSDCYSVTGSTSQKGIPVWWNGSAWTDAIGATVKY